MAGPGSDTFHPMESLLEDWLARARLPEAVRVVQLVKAELDRRGVVLSGSVSQMEVEVEGPCRAASAGSRSGFPVEPLQDAMNSWLEHMPECSRPFCEPAE